MKLHELLSKISYETMVAINNVETPRRGKLTYQKAENINLKKIRNILDYEIMSISVTSGKGLFILIYSKDRLDRDVNNWDLAHKIKRVNEGR